MLAAEIIGMGILAVADSSTAGALLASIGANHLGGRLAFIGMGLEHNLPALWLILIIIFYNSTYVLLTYSIFVLFSNRFRRFRFFRDQMRALINQAKKRRRFLRRWNRMAIFLFVWVPLPWTGAAIGSYIAHMEGFSPRETLATVLPAMWVGVASWTLWFDVLYRFVDRFGQNRSLLITGGLLAVPVVILVYELAGRKKRSNEGASSDSASRT